MIISCDKKVPQRMVDLKHTLLKQKYPENVIDARIQRALHLKRSELRQSLTILLELQITQTRQPLSILDGKIPLKNKKYNHEM